MVKKYQCRCCGGTFTSYLRNDPSICLGCLEFCSDKTRKRTGRKPAQNAKKKVTFRAEKKSKTCVVCGDSYEGAGRKYCGPVCARRPKCQSCRRVPECGNCACVEIYCSVCSERIRKGPPDKDALCCDCVDKKWKANREKERARERRHRLQSDQIWLRMGHREDCPGRGCRYFDLNDTWYWFCSPRGRIRWRGRALRLLIPKCRCDHDFCGYTSRYDALIDMLSALGIDARRVGSSDLDSPTLDTFDNEEWESIKMLRYHPGYTIIDYERYASLCAERRCTLCGYVPDPLFRDGDHTARSVSKAYESLRGSVVDWWCSDCARGKACVRCGCMSRATRWPDGINDEGWERWCCSTECALEHAKINSFLPWRTCELCKTRPIKRRRKYCRECKKIKSDLVEPTRNFNATLFKEGVQNATR